MHGAGTATDGAGTVTGTMTAPSYRAQVANAFEVLAEGLAPFVDERMRRVFPDGDWILLAAQKLGKRRDVLVSLTDPHFLLEVVNRWWGPAFAADLPDQARATVTDLRTARNHWAHPDPDHPFDFERALEVHRDAETLLAAIDSPLQPRLEALTDDLRLEATRQAARDEGIGEAEILLGQLASLEKERQTLQGQLDDARNLAERAAGRSRAVARQLAELQTQYAAVAGLRDDYLVLKRQLDAERLRAEEQQGDTTELRRQLDETESAADRLATESELLRLELERTRASIDEIPPTETAVGRRWLWLISALIVVLGLLVVLVASLPS